MYFLNNLKLLKFVVLLIFMCLPNCLLLACEEVKTSSPNSSSATSVTPEMVSIRPSYSEWYTDLASLKRNASLVVAGSVSKVNPAVFEKPYARTTVDFAVDEIIFNLQNLIQNKQTISITQVGGKVDNKIYEIEGNPVLKNGEQAVLFLKYDNDSKLYYIIGGPSGRFTIQNNQITPLTRDGVKIEANKSKSQFISEIKM